MWRSAWKRITVLLVLASALGVAGAWAEKGPPVSLRRVPEGGLQPQVAVDEKGVIHLLYFKGDPPNGDLYYVRSRDGGVLFSSPMKVNSQPGSAVAVGNIRGAHLALGSDGQVHVAWMGSRHAQPQGPGHAAPMLYTRLNPARTAFEPQRNVIQFAYGLDGGGSLAADRAGHVYVAWHADAGAKAEEARKVFVARSTDNGRTFARETPAWDQATGACGCCGMRAFADRAGHLYMLYRSAKERVHRDMYLLFSNDRGARFQGTDIHPWQINYCAMSTSALTEGPGGVRAAWETEGQVYFAPLDTASGQPRAPIAAPGPAEGRKHPALAVNAQGNVLLLWTEGMRWNQGGSVHWQLFDAHGRPQGKSGRADGVPAHSLVAGFVRPDGGFTVIY